MEKHRVSWVALVWECLGNPFLFVTYKFPLSKKYTLFISKNHGTIILHFKKVTQVSNFSFSKMPIQHDCLENYFLF